MTKAFVLIAVAAALAGCGGDDGPRPNPTPSPTPTGTPSPSPTPSPTPTPTAVRVTFSFNAGTDGFLADYADYSLGQEATIGFTVAIRPLPAPLAGRFGFLLSSNNRSDDVFMGLVRPVSGLAPGRRYRIDTSVSFATNAPPGCVGIGGAPGESVFVKAGASPVAPSRRLDGQTVRVNFDKGNQGTSGTDVAVIGNFAQPTAGDSCANPSYQLKTLTSGTTGPVVTADAQGRLWIVLGTDSGYEGRTDIYWLDGSVTFTPV